MSTDPMLFYEDLEPGGAMTSAVHTIDRDELVTFARAWDPMPFHIDEQAGHRAFGGITAPGLYMLAVKQRLVHSMSPIAVVASLGYDEVRFHAPLRPGDNVVLQAEWVTRRESASKPDRGLVTIRFSLLDGSGRTVMSHMDTVLVRRRCPRAISTVNSSAFASS